MVSRDNIWFGLILSVAAIGWLPGLCLAQKDKPTIEQILQVWKSRQEKVATARFELNCEETIHKGSTSLLGAHRRKMTGLPPESEPNPPRDFLVKGTSILSLDGPKLRYSYDHQQWDPIGKKLYPESYVDVFDGRLYKFLQNPASGQKDYPVAAIRTAEMSRSALKFPMLPLIFTVRGNHSQFFQNLGNFQLRGQVINVAGRSCLELIHGSGRTNNREVLYLDQERDYVVVREMILAGDLPKWQLDITYRPDSGIGWIPQSWEYIIRAGTDRDILHSGRYTVSRYEINPLLATNEFDISIAPKTRVHDERSGNYVEYIIREDGEQGRAIPATLNPTYEDLQKAETRINRRMMLGVWGAISVLAFGGWIWLRLRRQKRDPQQS